MQTPEIEPLDLFLNSFGSKQTQNKYRNRLDHFLTQTGFKGTLQDKARAFVKMATDNMQRALGCVAKYLSAQKARFDAGEITAGTLRNYYKPLKLFCESADIEIPWKKLVRGLPRPRKFAQDRVPTTEEIQKILQYPDRRIKPIVLLMASAGFRVGAWDYLKWGHIEPVVQDGKITAAKVRVYAGEPDEYLTFATPEAYLAAKDWMDLRQEHGEKISPKSWVMRDLFRMALLKHGAHYGMTSTPQQLKASGIRTMLKRAWVSQGLMKEKDGKLYEFKSSHGFRKRFKTQCELAGVRPLNIECMMGHDTGIAGSSYYRPTESEMLQDYLKAVPALTILPENRQLLQLQNQEEQIAELKMHRARIQHLEEGIDIIGALHAEQSIKNDLRKELDHPTHHHTPEQIESLRKIAESPPNRKVWEEYMNWAKKGQEVYSKQKGKTTKP